MQFAKQLEVRDTLRGVIAAEMKKYRKRHELSQTGMARKLRVSIRTYVDLEHGATLAATMTVVTFLQLLSPEELAEFLDATKIVMQ